jgi:hypothetical protein
MATGVLTLLAVLLGGVLWYRGNLADGASAGSPPDPGAPSLAPVEDKPLPLSLQQREPNQVVMLLKNNFDPIWEKQLLGAGQRQRWPDRLCLFSPPSEEHTLLALDTNPQRHWFEFAMELSQVRTRAPSPTIPLGAFFGWRRNPNDPDRRYPFFLARLEEAEQGLERRPRAVVELAYLDEGNADRRSYSEWGRSLPSGLGVLELPACAADGWRRLQLRVVDDHITLTVDGAALKIELRDLNTLPAPYRGTLDPRGILGIWSGRGAGSFRNISVTALPSEKTRP